ncbi:hypothetical protein Mapa_000552 [Marchantia paleacea]|nr:hypothetical protein Mapa_000552 [Marchantia paleacea]
MSVSLLRVVLLWMLASSVYCGDTQSTFVEELKTQMVINTSRVVATIDETFLCATLDWWPSSKCNYGSCPWGHAGLLNLDLGNPLLERTLAGLAPFTIRIGGTLQDLIVYNVGDHMATEPCLPFVYNASALFSYTGGCLPMEKWDAMNVLFMKTGVSVAFGLNALYGRSKSSEYNVVGPWNPSNAANFIRYTRDRAYPVTAWQLGNELLGAGIGKTVAPDLYAADVQKLRNVVDEIYREDTTKPVVVAPDSFYDVGSKEIPKFLKSSGPNVVDVVTRHIYNLGAGVTETNELIGRVLSRVYADSEAAKYKSMQSVLQEYPKTTAWVGEAGGAYNSGHHQVTDAFIFAFWYLDQLGMASRYNNQVFCRQSFIGGHYGLVDANFNPNPDYYGALLWRQLMGRGVLVVDIINGTNDVRAYAHCQKDKKGGLALLVLNYSNTTKHNLDVSLLGFSTPTELHNYRKLVADEECETASCHKDTEGSSGSLRLEYHMSPANGMITSQTVLLNGQPLQITPSGQVPTLSPMSVDSSSPISLDPLTYAYVVISNANAPACLVD